MIRISTCILSAEIRVSYSRRFNLTHKSQLDLNPRFSIRRDSYSILARASIFVSHLKSNYAEIVHLTSNFLDRKEPEEKRKRRNLNLNRTFLTLRVAARRAAASYPPSTRECRIDERLSNCVLCNV